MNTSKYLILMTLGGDGYFRVDLIGKGDIRVEWMGTSGRSNYGLLQPIVLTLRNEKGT